MYLQRSALSALGVACGLLRRRCPGTLTSCRTSSRGFCNVSSKATRDPRSGTGACVECNRALEPMLALFSKLCPAAFYIRSLLGIPMTAMSRPQ